MSDPRQSGSEWDRDLSAANPGDTTAEAVPVRGLHQKETIQKVDLVSGGTQKCGATSRTEG